jgi:hypothetical protein
LETVLSMFQRRQEPFPEASGFRPCSLGQEGVPDRAAKPYHASSRVTTSGRDVAISRFTSQGIRDCHVVSSAGADGTPRSDDHSLIVLGTRPRVPRVWFIEENKALAHEGVRQPLDAPYR